MFIFLTVISITSSLYAASNSCKDLFRTTSFAQMGPVEKITHLTNSLIGPDSPLLFGPIHTLALSRIETFKSNRGLTKKVADGSYELNKEERELIAKELLDEFLAFFATGLSHQGRVVTFGAGLLNRRYIDGIDEYFVRSKSGKLQILKLDSELLETISNTIKDWNKRGSPYWTTQSYLSVRDSLVEIQQNTELRELFLQVLGMTLRSSSQQLNRWQLGLNAINRLSNREQIVKKALTELHGELQNHRLGLVSPRTSTSSSQKDRLGESPTTSSKNSTKELVTNEIPSSQLGDKRLILHHLTQSVPLLFGPVHIWASSRVPTLNNKKWVSYYVENNINIPQSKRKEIALNIYDELHSFFHTARATRWRLTTEYPIRLTRFGEPLLRRRYADGVDESWTNDPNHYPSPKHVDKAIKAWSRNNTNWTSQMFHTTRKALIAIDSNAQAKALFLEILENSMEVILPGVAAKHSNVPRLLKYDLVEQGVYNSINGPTHKTPSLPKSAPQTGTLSTGKDFLTEAQFENILNSPHPNKLEIGAADSPLCRNCIQVDKFTSSADMYIRGEGTNVAPWITGRKRRRAQKREQETSIEDRILHHGRLAGEHESEIWKPFAVATADRGVVADAINLPFADNSMKLVITKNFAWFNNGMSPKNISHYVQEYIRVVEPGGKILILLSSNKKPNPKSEIAPHIKVSKSLGLKVEYYHGHQVQGIILTVPN